MSSPFRCKRPALLLPLLGALFAPAPAHAHQSSVAYSDIRVSGREIFYTLDIASSDLAEPLRAPILNTTLLASRKDDLFAYASSRIQVDNHGHPCAPSLDRLETRDKAEGFFVTLHLRFTCARQVEQLAIRYRLFFDLDSRHQGFARLDIGDGMLRQFVFRQGQRTWDVMRPVGLAEHSTEYLVLGIEHIFTGYDHILFLCGLLLIAAVKSNAARGMRAGLLYTLKIVTAFTLAHSLTLICAALGLVHLPTRLTEAGIALSIAYIGAENLAIGDPRYRWLLTFAFGLVHGFGFATVLADVGLPSRNLLASLLSFNAGVELGQICIVVALLPLLHVIARRSIWTYRRIVLQGGSCVIVALGLLWFIERAFAVAVLGGALG